METVYERQTDPERLFINSIKSEYTKKVYLIHIRKYLEFARCRTLNELATEFHDPKDVERRVIDFIIHLKEQGKKLSMHQQLSNTNNLLLQDK